MLSSHVKSNRSAGVRFSSSCSGGVMAVTSQPPTPQASQLKAGSIKVVMVVEGEGGPARSGGREE
ncbi:hypothetical protein E2C01_042653 [Portunus trituberculatus]|uniref:Uncharacterized protein n=1 Tax=Portunus trituberculatus TaxID=210409 RepID=A0A5B7FU00_PORTR|nr:hypothetical protein [Portunus trituberculatus]